ncbi:MAG TPA: DUF692 domain-containing protein [Coleofasciculaceae cyanobacterium]
MDQASLPQLGVGLGLRRQLFPDIKANHDRVDWLEIITENYMGKGGRRRQILDEALELGFPIVPHGLTLSLGGTDPFPKDYLQELAALLEKLNSPWFSDHLCFTSHQGMQFYELMPLPYTWEAVHHVVQRIRFIQDRFGIPFLIENASAYALLGKPEMTEGQFIGEIVERSGCGLLLDVNNVYVNARNFNTDPLTFLAQIPMERVVQLHMAGHRRDAAFIVDTHGEAICEEVYDLLSEVLKRTQPCGILLERDSNIPALSELQGEMVRIRRIAREAQDFPATEGSPLC